MIRQLFHYMRPYRWYAIFSPIMMILEVSMDILIPMLMANVVDHGIAMGDTNYVLQTCTWMVCAALFGMLMGTWSSHLGATAGYGTACEIRKAAYHQIQEFSFNNIDQMRPASLITRLTTDIETIGQVVMMSTRMAFRAPFLLILALIFAIRINAQLALIFAVALPAISLIIFLILRRAIPMFTSIRERVDDLNGVTQEQLRGIRVIKSFNRQDFARNDFKEKNTNLRNTAVRALKMMTMLNPLLLATIYICMLAVLWFGGLQIQAGTATTGTIIAFMTYVIQIMIAVMLVSAYAFNLVYGLASLRRVTEVINTHSEIENPAEPLHALQDGSIEFQNVYFKYPGYRDDILENINLKILSGQNIGIIGSTGSSKSTLVQMIPRLYDVDQGAVIVGGHDVRDYDMHALRHEIGFVLQKNILVSGTLRENLQWGNPNATDEQMIQALKQAQAWDFVSQYPEGLDHPVAQGGSNFSGGQRQRLTIARALLTDPKILILDDSTSAVDTDTDARIRSMFKRELDDITTIMIAQRVNSIRDCDQIIVMNQGKIDAVGTHDELMKNSAVYQEIANSQQKGVRE